MFCLIPLTSQNKVEPRRAKASSNKNGYRECGTHARVLSKHLCIETVSQIDIGNRHAENNKGVIKENWARAIAIAQAYLSQRTLLPEAVDE